MRTYVVAPEAGGPATYVEDGVTGALTATWDVGGADGGARLGPRRRPAPSRTTRVPTRPAPWCATASPSSAWRATLDGVYRGVAREEAELRKPVERAV